MLWVKSSCFFKNCVFPENGESLPYSIGPFCFSTDQNFLNFLKFERGCLCLFRPVEADFWPIETLVSGFLKSRIGLFQSHYSNFFKLLSLSALALGSTIKFLSFSFKIFARFLSLEAGKTLLPFFFKFISCFHAFFMHSNGYFRHLQNCWGFLMIQANSCVIDQWVFVPWCYIDDPYSLIWSILWFLKNWKF